MKHATAYRRKGRILVHAVSRTVTGLGQRAEPFVVLRRDATALELGDALCGALDASTTGVPTLTAMAELVAPLLQAFGVKSWSMFCAGAECTGVRLDGDRVFFSPTMNAGARIGFRRLLEHEFSIPANSDRHAMGEALRRALDLARAAE